MSRQYDDYASGRFDIYGEEYSLIEPDSPEELAEALALESLLEECTYSVMHDDEYNSGYENLLEEQRVYIQEYIDRIDNFDSTNLSKNISFLCKKSGLKIGQLEDALGISAGYISRTVKANSKKKMSIDIVWKLARVFDTDINTMTELQMWISHTNTDLLEKFLHKLFDDTKKKSLSWTYDGGCSEAICDRYLHIELFTRETNGNIVYHPDYFNLDEQFILCKDIVSLNNFNGNKDLVVIPYKNVGEKIIKGFDYIFLWRQAGRWCWEKVFYTSEDQFGELKILSEKLYQLIETERHDVKLTSKIKQVIKNYVIGGGEE